jgi:pyrroloquinoline quinone biosynthesis protein B
MTKYLFLALVTIIFMACNDFYKKESIKEKPFTGLQLMILGVAQDAGYPQAGCQKACCKLYTSGKEQSRSATSIAIIDKDKGKKWLFEATPDIKDQLYSLQTATPQMEILPNGVFLTHAHVGHYTGLIHFGREAMGTSHLPVFAMPKMKRYLTNQGPWSQLVALNNINIQPLAADSSVQLSANLEVTPFRVPHRDEYSETVGYQIKTSNKTILFIPDIDKWQKWEKDIIEVIQSVDLALIDGTFYNNAELPNRDMSEIPHPFIEESMAIFKNMPASEKSKIMFIHFNHTNPVMRNTSESKTVLEAGFQLAREGQFIKL